jgi:(E)-4-hydroxy-3-methylbut-2-enyl-diphosphate synthase
MERLKTRQINVGGVLVGGGAPVAVQSMCDTDTRDTAAVLAQIAELHTAGCDIIRVAVPDAESAEALRTITAESPIPVVADIHFDYKLALLSLKNGAAKIRINPGNIGNNARVREVAKACAERGVPIRIGVNSGSVKRGLLEKYGAREAMLMSGLEQAAELEDAGFHDIALSFKASNVPDTVAVNRLAAERCDYPLHIGVTGTGTNGIIKSAVGIGALLLDGIGDTVRVSLTAPVIWEVRAAIEMLKAVGLREAGIEIIACPTCARRKIDVAALAEKLEACLPPAPPLRNLKIAIMGCSVNGPGEARDADMGSAPDGHGQALLFRKGAVIGKIAESEIIDTLIKMIEEEKETHK